MAWIVAARTAQADLLDAILKENARKVAEAHRDDWKKYGLILNDFHMIVTGSDN